MLWGEGGNDAINGDSGNDVLDGGDGEDTLAGGNGDDVLYGGAGADNLLGGNGNDTLDGGGGNDRMLGGLGNNTYWFGVGDGQDVIGYYSDASAAKHNVLRFRPGVTASQMQARRVLDTDFTRPDIGDGPNNAGYASLELRIAGTSDTIFIDGTQVGTGPVVKRPLAPRKDPYEIRVKLRGEERVRFVQVKEGRLTRLRIAPPWSR